MEFLIGAPPIALLWAALLAGAVAAGVLMLLVGTSDPLRWQAARAMRAEEGLVFLLDEAGLVDATPRARALIDKLGEAGSERDRLLHYLRVGFDGAAEALGRLGAEPVRIDGAQGALFEAERAGDLIRVEISDPRPGRRDDTRIETASLRAMEEELALLRTAAEAAPWPCWHASREGEITWVNAAYLDLVDGAAASAGAPPVWPPAQIFGTVPMGAARRVEIDMARGGGRAFDCRAAPTAGGTFNFAAPADAAARAEERLSRFSAALTETFAQLEVGLAIFDEERRLALFNPALSTLTRLPGEFLGARPTLPALLDRLREGRMMPEPRDYAAWRARIASLDESAGTGTFRETWTLPMGETWRVTGRPHPGGAIALIFEDMTAETSLARQFREEMEIGQGIVDAMRGAVAVFDASGTLALANAAYADLWDADPCRLAGDVTVADAARRWERHALPSTCWAELRARLAAGPGAGPWSGEALLRDGRRIDCTATSLAHGATMVRFDAAPGLSRGLTLVPPKAGAGAAQGQAMA